jgi:hypothetical protein
MVSTRRACLDRHRRLTRVVARRQLRTENQLSFETPRLEAPMCLGDVIQGDALGDATRRYPLTIVVR